MNDAASKPVKEKRRLIDVKRLRELVLLGQTDSQIAETMGHHEVSIQTARKRHGIAPATTRKAAYARGLGLQLQHKRLLSSRLADAFGLPETLSNLQIRAIISLVEGAKKASELRTALGLTSVVAGVLGHRARKPGESSRSSLMGELLKAGLVFRFRPPKQSEWSYMLTAKAYELLANTNTEDRNDEAVSEDRESDHKEVSRAASRRTGRASSKRTGNTR